MKLALTVQYDGKNFLGFQKQKSSLSGHGRTVQEELEKAFATFFRQEIRIYAAGRTDRGVSALGQVIHFSLQENVLKNKSIEKILYSVNSILPPEISLSHAAIVPESFHARFSCLQREYMYLVYNSPTRSALVSKSSLWVRHPLQLKNMRAVLDVFLGEQDFAAFTQAVYFKNKKPTIRRIDEISILQKGHFLIFYFRGSGFLHNMIRILSGTLLDVGKGRLSRQDLERILLSRDRTQASKTLPPHALFFVAAKYKDYTDENEKVFPLLF